MASSQLSSTHSHGGAYAESEHRCAVCFQEGSDLRVLSYLHSFCRGCIDHLALSEGREQEVKCPLCRTCSPLPKNGAAGLPKYMTRSTRREVQAQVECGCCKPKGEAGEQVTWCGKCEVALCKEHVVEYMMSGSGPSSHSFGDLPKDGSTSVSADGGQASTSLCVAHNEPIKYFCKQCNVAVCGGCAVIGKHRGHSPVVILKEVARDLRRKAQTEAKN